MRKNMKTRAAAVVATGALSLGAFAAPAMAQGPVVTGGLVNITVTDVLNNNQVAVQVPIGIAANLCNVQANVLAQNMNTNQTVRDCTASTTQDLPVAFRP